MSVRIRVRLFAIQRELAGTREVALELPDGADVEARLGGAGRPVPGPRARAAVDALRAQRGVRGPGHESGRRRRGGDDPAGLRRRRRRRPARPGSWSCARRPFGAAILGELADRLAVPEDGAFVGFLGRTRSTPGTPAPGQEAEAARHAGRAVESLEYEAHETMALAVLATIAEEVGGPVRRDPAGDRPSDRRGAAGRAVDRGRRRRSAPGRGLRRGSVCDRRDQGPRADLEGGAVRRRPRLDRPPGADRAREARRPSTARGRSTPRSA